MCSSNGRRKHRKLWHFLAEGNALIKISENGFILRHELVVFNAPNGADFGFKTNTRSFSEFVDFTGLYDIFLEGQRRTIKHHRRPTRINTALDDFDI